jgi:hypothetical protein
MKELLRETFLSLEKVQMVMMESLKEVAGVPTKQPLLTEVYGSRNGYFDGRVWQKSSLFKAKVLQHFMGTFWT